MKVVSKPKVTRARAPWSNWIVLVAIGAIVASTSMVVDTIPAQAAGNDAQLLKDAQRAFKPLPKDAATAEFPITPERVELGRKLFFDPRISIDGTVSCSRCHQAALYATDGLPKAKGAFDKLNDRRAPRCSMPRCSSRLTGAGTART